MFIAKWRDGVDLKFVSAITCHVERSETSLDAFDTLRDQMIRDSSLAQNDNKGCTEPLGPNSRDIDGYEAVTS